MTADDITWRPFVRAEWMADAACRGMPTAIFFPEYGQRAINARRVCQDCPVADECRRFAVDNDERFGVWGGLAVNARYRATRWAS